MGGLAGGKAAAVLLKEPPTDVVAFGVLGCVVKAASDVSSDDSGEVWQAAEMAFVGLRFKYLVVNKDEILKKISKTEEDKNQKG